MAKKLKQTSRSVKDGTVLWKIGKQHNRKQMRDLPWDYIEWYAANADPKGYGMKRLQRELKRRSDVANGLISDAVIEKHNPCDSHPRVFNWDQNNSGYPSLCCAVCETKKGKPKFITWVSPVHVYENWDEYPHIGIYIPDRSALWPLLPPGYRDAHEPKTSLDLKEFLKKYPESNPIMDVLKRKS